MHFRQCLSALDWKRRSVNNTWCFSITNPIVWDPCLHQWHCDFKWHASHGAAQEEQHIWCVKPCPLFQPYNSTPSKALLKPFMSSVYRSSPMDLKKTNNPAQPNWKGPDLWLQLPQFRIFPVSSCHT
jgi:hypothetical protein